MCNGRGSGVGSSPPSSCCAARKIRSSLGFALILNSGRHGTATQILPPAPSHPFPHLDASKHPSIHASMQGAQPRILSLPRTARAQLVSTGVCRNLPVCCTLAVSPSVRLASFSGRCTIGPRSEAEWPAGRSGVWPSSLICSPFARLLHGHGGRGPCPSIPTPDSTTQLSFKFSSGRSRTPGNRRRCPPVLSPASPVCGGLATSNRGRVPSRSPRPSAVHTAYSTEYSNKVRLLQIARMPAQAHTPQTGTSSARSRCAGRGMSSRRLSRARAPRSNQLTRPDQQE